jgi:hypothetical protein
VVPVHQDGASQAISPGYLATSVEEYADAISQVMPSSQVMLPRNVQIKCDFSPEHIWFSYAVSCTFSSVY